MNNTNVCVTDTVEIEIIKCLWKWYNASWKRKSLIKRNMPFILPFTWSLIEYLTVRLLNECTFRWSTNLPVVRDNNCILLSSRGQPHLEEVKGEAIIVILCLHETCIIHYHYMLSVANICCPSRCSCAFTSPSLKRVILIMLTVSNRVSH